MLLGGLALLVKLMELEVILKDEKFMKNSENFSVFY